MLLAILLSAVPAVIAQPPGAKPICRAAEVIVANRLAQTPGIHPLGEEPPARHILAVVRTDFDGCVKPVVVNARVGER